VSKKEINEEEWTEEDFEAGALEAGIPPSVIRGEAKLSDKFSKDYIDFKCNRREAEYAFMEPKAFEELLKISDRARIEAERRKEETI